MLSKEIASSFRVETLNMHDSVKLVNTRRLLDRAQVTDEEEKVEDEEDNDLLKAFKVLFTF